MLLLYLFLFLKASVNKNYKICIPPQYNRGGGGISFLALTAQKKKDSRRNPVQQRGSQQCGGAVWAGRKASCAKQVGERLQKWG